VLVSQYVAATETTQYTCPAGSAVTIDSATVANDSGNSVDLRVSLVKSGGTAGTSNRVAVFKGTGTLGDGDSAVLSELKGHKLGPGDFISAIASAGSRAVLTLSGTVFS
jgi:hypothetical protein